LPRTHLFIAVVVVAFAFGCAPAQSQDSPRTRTRTRTQTRTAQKQPEVYQQRLIDWLLEDPDAFFHPGILWKRLGPDGTSGPYAYHATEDIPKGTPLIILPRRYVIESALPAPQPGVLEYGDDARVCLTVHKMIEEYQKVLKAKEKNDDNSNSSSSSSNSNNNENGSFYEPYLSYLFDETVGGTSRGLLPTTWSAPAQAILDTILDYREEHELNFLEPDDYRYGYVTEWCEYQEGDHDINALIFDDDNYFDDGDDDNFDDENDEAEEETETEETETETEEQIETEETLTDNNDGNQRVALTLDEQLRVLHAQDALLFLTSRGWNDKLLPIVDMLNHINGPARNVEVTPIDDSSPPKDVAAYTSRDVKAGEQLQYSYSECFDETCDFGKIKYDFHTQTIFKEYGFVELYPQRWYLGGTFEDKTDPDGVQELTVEVDRDGATNELILRWIFQTPNSATLEWVQTQLDRLLSIESEIRERVASLAEAVGKEFGEDLQDIFNVEHERYTILEYFEGYVMMLRLALKHKDDPLYISKPDFALELEELMRSGRKLTIHDIRNHDLLKEAAPLADDEL